MFMTVHLKGQYFMVDFTLRFTLYVGFVALTDDIRWNQHDVSGRWGQHQSQ